MLRYRLLLGTLLIAALAGLCALDARSETPGVYLLPLALAATALGADEFARLAGRRLPVPHLLLCAGSVIIVLSNWAPAVFAGRTHIGPWGWPAIAFGLSLALVFADEIRRYEAPGKAIERLATAALGLAYCGLLMSFVVQLRFFATPDESRWGVVALVSLIVVVKMCDTGAYTVGRMIGKHKLAPRLSPGKTIEGAAGGLAFACFGAWATFTWLAPLLIDQPPGTPIFRSLTYGLIVGVAGMLGDLAESLLKRDVSAKDSSTWLPGFGGVLDILDSILYAAPAAYACWALHLVGL